MDGQASVRRPKQRRVAETERRRAVRACDGCRRQKEKCEGGIPCQRCIRFCRQCEFHSHNARDGGTRHPRCTSLDDPNIAELSERSKCMETLLRHHVPGICLDTETLRTMVEALTNSDVSIPQDTEEILTPDIMPEQNQPDTMEDLSLNENFTVKPLAHNITHYSGEFSYWNFSMRIKQWIEDWVPDSNAEGAQQATKIKEFYRAEHLESPYELASSLSYLPPRHIAEFLVYIFFKYAETNYFYINRDWLRTALNAAYNSSSHLSSKDAGTVCSILIILAIGTQYAYLDSEDSVGLSHEKPQAPDKPAFSEDDIGLMFFQQASKLIPDVIIVASLESVQACLLIGLYTLPLDTSGLSYIYLNLAVKLGIQNGMHRKYVGDGFDDTTIEIRNCVWWTAFTLERRVCILHGRPISILWSDVDASEPTDYQGMRPPGMPSNTPNMLASIKLTKFLENLANEVSVLRRAQKPEQSRSLKNLSQTKSNLLNWWSTLPEETFCKDRNPQGALFRPNMHLNLEYCLIRMYVGRPFMFSQHSSTSPSSVLDEFDNPITRTSTRSKLIEDCVQAALEVIEICQSLRKVSGLARASYTEFSSCRAALLVIIAQSLHKKSEELRQALHDGMSMIRTMSAGGDSARSEVSLIEAFETAISRMDSMDGVSRSNIMASKGSGYDLFKDWEQLWKNDRTAPNSQFQEQARIPPSNPSVVCTENSVGDPTASLFVLDNLFNTNPQVLEEFSAIPTFEYDFEVGVQDNQWGNMNLV